MALRNTRGNIVTMVRAEAKLSTNTSRGIDQLENIQQLISRHYLMLAEDFDWEHLQIKKGDTDGRKSLAAGQRYYDFPVKLNPLKIEEAWVKWGSIWRKLNFGIDFENYSEQDPEVNQRTDPVTAWDFYGGTGFEVWPLPLTDHTTAAPNQIGFVGQALPEQIIDDTSRLDMDDMLVALMVAAEILAGDDQEAAAKVKTDAASRRMNQLRRGLSDKSRVTIGRGRISEGGQTHPRRIDYVRFVR